MRLKTFGNMEQVAEQSFYKFDTENKGYWSLENLSAFFVESLKTKKDSINTNLINQGYAPNLDYYLSPLNDSSPFYYEENNVKEYMPRYFIGNNKKYMEKLFSLAKNKDKFIVEKTQNLLQELCTSEDLKNGLFGLPTTKNPSNNLLEGFSLYPEPGSNRHRGEPTGV